MVNGQDLLGKLNLSRVPPRVPVIGFGSGASAYWVGQSKATPVSRQAFDRLTVFSKKVAALTIVSNELLNSADPRAEQRFLQDLISAAVSLSDWAFVDPSNSGSDSTPASVTSGASPITSGGDLADDAEAALAVFSGDLTTASWICHPRTAAQAGIRSGNGGVGANLGARGGSLAGLPCYVSESVPFDSSGGLLILIDANKVALVDEGFTVRRSTVGMVEMSNTPAGATDTPVAANTVPVSLFQSETTALMITRAVNWKAAESASVVVIEGANYGAAP